MKILVGFSAGSPSDALARAMGEKLSRSFRQPAIVENKPGAGGIVAAKALLQAPPDGHTMLVVSAAHAATPVIRLKMEFDPVAEIAGITRIANVPSMLVVNRDIGVRTLQDLIERSPETPIHIDLTAGTLVAGDLRLTVSMPPKIREALVTGAWDTTGLLLDRYDEVDAASKRLPYVSGF